MSDTRFKPGQSGNPGGRPKGYAGIAKQIRKETRDGAELVEYSLGVLRDPGADWRDRAAAREWLTDYGFGKAPQVISIESDAEPRSIDLSKLSDEQLAVLVEADLLGKLDA